MDAKELEKKMRQQAAAKEIDLRTARRAWICKTGNHNPDRRGIPHRVFLGEDVPLDYVPVCPDHPSVPMEKQENNVYMGTLVATLDPKDFA